MSEDEAYGLFVIALALAVFGAAYGISALADWLRWRPKTHAPKPKADATDREGLRPFACETLRKSEEG